jgi:cyclophilin family peptidyl-prolyl cis-trans isomerase/HEAT repeat protein
VLATEDARRYNESVLVRAARYTDPIVRRRAALAMGRIGDTAAVPNLVELLADPDTAVQRDAAFSLGLLRARSAVEPLWALVHDAGPDADSPLYDEAVAAIAKSAPPAQAAALFESLWTRTMGAIEAGHPPAVAVRAALVSWRLGTDAPVGTLVRLAQTGNPRMRRAAVYTLARLRAPEALERLVVATADEDPDIRAWAARAMTRATVDSAGLASDAAAVRLGELARDGNAGVRIQALRSLATYDDSALAPTAIDRLSDRDVNVRIEALATLGRLGGSAARGALRESTDQGPYAVRRQALLSLARVDRAVAIRKSAAWITSADWRTRATGAEALGIIAGDTADAWLESLLQDSDGRVGARALGALGDADSARARRAALGLLAQSDPVLRAEALDLLRTRPAQTLVDSAIAAYDRALGDAIPDARMAAMELLGAIAALDPSARAIVEGHLLRDHPTCDDYLVRRAAAAHLPGVAARWGPEFPLATGREAGDYREIARSLLLPADRGERLPELVVETDRGRLTIELFAADAPITVHALLDLVARRYFDGGSWHRVVPNFVIQDGDPRGDGAGGPGFSLRDELNRHRYDRGVVGMALSGPDTGGSQFFITVAPQPHLDGTYTVIGRVTRGMDVADRTIQGDRIKTVRVR